MEIGMRTTECTAAPASEALLAFSAPYLEKKLLSVGIAESRDEAGGLFRELKRYLVLALEHPELSLPMFSLRVDRAWHEFILFTQRYTQFCLDFAGRYLHHEPAGASSSERPDEDAKVVSFVDFRALYEARFGGFSALWFDETAVRPGTRVAWSLALAQLTVRTADQRVELLEVSAEPRVLCRTALRARSALEFIALHRFFHVRELPLAGRTADALVLARTLVQHSVLIVTD